MNILIQEIKNILSQLNAEELPQIYDYLAGLLSAGDSTTAYVIADNLIQLDKKEPFPTCIANFIRELFEIEISAGNHDAMNDLGALY